jgi:hypothetical protein
MPSVEPIVATEVVPLVQIPPAVALDNVTDPPIQTLVGPVIGATAGSALTVMNMLADALQPAAFVTVYNIIDVPAATPVTTPDEEPTVATVRSLLLHTPPEVALLNVVVAATHTVEAPVIAATVGKLFTVTVFVTTLLPQILTTV